MKKKNIVYLIFNVLFILSFFELKMFNFLKNIEVLSMWYENTTNSVIIFGISFLIVLGLYFYLFEKKIYGRPIYINIEKNKILAIKDVDKSGFVINKDFSSRDSIISNFEVFKSAVIEVFNFYKSQGGFSALELCVFFSIKSEKLSEREIKYISRVILSCGAFEVKYIPILDFDTYSP